MRRTLALLPLLAATACAGELLSEDAAPTPDAHPSWSYHGETGPDFWAELDANFELCGDVAQQTPIDIPASALPGLQPAIAPDYHRSTLTLVNTGHTIQANLDPGSALRVDDAEYELLQFHFHAHSEHSVGGRVFPLELHFVHKRPDSDALAVVAVFVAEGAENAALVPVFEHLPAEPGEPAAVSGSEIDPAALLPSAPWAWRYRGSLSTPPCTGGVDWIVYDQPITASAAQISSFTRLYRYNYRPVQALGERTVSGAHFDYEGESGPLHWGELAAGWGLCQSGKEQSPIDVPEAVEPAPFPGLQITYQPTPLHIIDNGHTMQVDYASGSSIAIAGSEYELLQFHFHAHSEHSVAGHIAPLELHLVHRSRSQALAVIGVLIEEGEENAALGAIFDNLPDPAELSRTAPDVQVDASALLPDDLAMWRYEGSLTTPPCSENVHWHVLASPIHASPAQIAAFTARYSAAARPVQPLGSRSLL